MGIIGWIVVGILAGLLAKAIMPGDQDLGIFLTMALGIVGAMLGGWVMSLITGTGVTGFDLRTILVATVGALLVLWIVGMMRRSRH